MHETHEKISKTAACLKKFTVCLLASASLLSAGAITSVSAEEVKTPLMQEAERQNINLPRSGQSMSSVETEFGYPVKASGPVGQPPISTWEYQGYIVYFEGQTVIHAVLKPTK